MHIPATLEQARSTLAIMLGVAAAEGLPNEADKECIAAVTDYIFRIEEQFGLAGLTPLSPVRIATLAADSDVALQAASFAAVMALADGAVNVAKLSAAVRIADSLGVRDGYVDELARLAIQQIERHAPDQAGRAGQHEDHVPADAGLKPQQQRDQERQERQ